jgi:hypothetical protein
MSADRVCYYFANVPFIVIGKKLYLFLTFAFDNSKS